MFYCSNCLFKYPAEIACSSNAGEPAMTTISVKALIHENPETPEDNTKKGVTKQVDTGKERELENAESVDIEVIETCTCIHQHQV